jgi:hypothetical protein
MALAVRVTAVAPLLHVCVQQGTNLQSSADRWHKPKPNAGIQLPVLQNIEAAHHFTTAAAVVELASTSDAVDSNMRQQLNSSQQQLFSTAVRNYIRSSKPQLLLAPDTAPADDAWRSSASVLAGSSSASMCGWNQSSSSYAAAAVQRKARTLPAAEACDYTAGCVPDEQQFSLQSLFPGAPPYAAGISGVAVLSNISSSAAAGTIVQDCAGRQRSHRAGSAAAPDLMFFPVNQSLDTQQQLLLQLEPGIVCEITSELAHFKQQLHMQLLTPLAAAAPAISGLAESANLSRSSSMRDSAGSSPLLGNTLCTADERSPNSSAACRNSMAVEDQASMVATAHVQQLGFWRTSSLSVWFMKCLSWQVRVLLPLGMKCARQVKNARQHAAAT